MAVSTHLCYTHRAVCCNHDYDINRISSPHIFA